MSVASPARSAAQTKGGEVLLRTHPHRQAVLLVTPTQHVPVVQEAEPAKHPSLFDALHVLQDGSDPFVQRVVLCHGRPPGGQRGGLTPPPHPSCGSRILFTVCVETFGSWLVDLRLLPECKLLVELADAGRVVAAVVEPHKSAICSSSFRWGIPAPCIEDG